VPLADGRELFAPMGHKPALAETEALLEPQGSQPPNPGEAAVPPPTPRPHGSPDVARLRSTRDGP
jgi:hypothetical protein